MSKRRTIVIEQGATYRLRFLVRDADDLQQTPRDLSGWSVRMQVREAPDAPAAMLDLSTDNGSITVDLPNAEVDAVATAEQTAELPVVCDAVFDVVGTAPAGEPVERWLWGAARIEPRVTR